MRHTNDINNDGGKLRFIAMIDGEPLTRLWADNVTNNKITDDVCAHVTDGPSQMTKKAPFGMPYYRLEARTAECDARTSRDVGSRSSGNFARLRKRTRYRKIDARRPLRLYRLCDTAMTIHVRNLLTRVRKKRMCYWRRIKLLRTLRRSQSTLPPAATGNATRCDVNWAACYNSVFAAANTYIYSKITASKNWYFIPTNHLFKQ